LISTDYILNNTLSPEPKLGSTQPPKGSLPELTNDTTNIYFPPDGGNDLIGTDNLYGVQCELAAFTFEKPGVTMDLRNVYRSPLFLLTFLLLELPFVIGLIVHIVGVNLLLRNVFEKVGGDDTSYKGDLATTIRVFLSLLLLFDLIMLFVWFFNLIKTINMISKYEE
jgi:hypothetical protein